MMSEIFARFLGVYMLIMAAIWLTRKKQFEGCIRSVILTEGSFALTGAIHVMVGLILMLSNPIWELNWKGLVTLIGFLSILQGVFRLAFPEEAKKLIMKSVEKGHWIWIIFLIGLGTFLAYFGFYA